MVLKLRLGRPPLHVCLLYLLVCTLLATGLSFSRYASTNAASDAARVASGALSIRCDASSDGMSFDLDCNDGGITQESYSFTVTNRDGNKISDVAIKYDIVVKLSQPLPTGVTMALDGSPAVGSGTTYRFSGGTFAADCAEQNDHTLTITADQNQVTGSAPHELTLTVSVQAEQID